MKTNRNSNYNRTQREDSEKNHTNAMIFLTRSSAVNASEWRKKYEEKNNSSNVIHCADNVK